MPDYFYQLKWNPAKNYTKCIHFKKKKRIILKIKNFLFTILQVSQHLCTHFQSSSLITKVTSTRILKVWILLSTLRERWGKQKWGIICLPKLNYLLINFHFWDIWICTSILHKLKKKKKVNFICSFHYKIVLKTKTTNSRSLMLVSSCTWKIYCIQIY